MLCQIFIEWMHLCVFRSQYVNHLVLSPTFPLSLSTSLHLCCNYSDLTTATFNLMSTFQLVLPQPPWNSLAYSPFSSQIHLLKSKSDSASSWLKNCSTWVLLGERTKYLIVLYDVPVSLFYLLMYSVSLPFSSLLSVLP